MPLTPRTKEQWLAYALKLGVAVVIFVICIFAWVHLQTGTLVERQLLERARAHFQTILAARNWSAMHGGVYVVKTQGVESNPYLKNPDIHDDRGRTLTLKNPALMTREISELAIKEGLLTYHMTSLLPVNPVNAADDFERRALLRFETEDVHEDWGRETVGGRLHFRYIGALYVKRSCLVCHAEQGYQEGDVRGGISVSFDIQEVRQTLTRDRTLLLLVAAAAALALLAVFYVLTGSLMRRVEQSTDLIRRLSVTDDLTGLANRRLAMEALEREAQRAARYGKPSGLLMLDIDHFKRVNDTWGHQTGDMVLRVLAVLMRDQTRETDLVARFGGEEFLILLPEAAPHAALAVAEKIRTVVEAHPFATPGGERFRVTVSLGVACLAGGETVPDVEQALRRADEALYQAKQAGRNRVVLDSDER